MAILNFLMLCYIFKTIAPSSKEDVFNIFHSTVLNHYNKWALTSRENSKNNTISSQICNVNKRSLMNHNDNPLTKGKYNRVGVSHNLLAGTKNKTYFTDFTVLYIITFLDNT